ncbi:hypothetical protein Tco_1228124 [Tanacetum coccineum]
MEENLPCQYPHHMIAQGKTFASSTTRFESEPQMVSNEISITNGESEQALMSVEGFRNFDLMITPNACLIAADHAYGLMAMMSETTAKASGRQCQWRLLSITLQAPIPQCSKTLNTKQFQASVIHIFDLAPQRKNVVENVLFRGLVLKDKRRQTYDNSDPVAPRQYVVPSEEKTNSLT